MVSNPDLVFYACIARGTVILAEFNREPNLNDLAFRCIEKAPPHHSTFSHTVRNRVYTFLIEGPFVYFGIFHEDLFKSEVCGFLNRLRRAFEEFIESELRKGFENFTSNCFQSQFDSIFRRILTSNQDQTSSGLDSDKRKKTSLISKFSKPCSLMKKKKKVVGDANSEEGKYASTVDDSVDLYDDNNGLCSRDITLLMQKNGSYERQKAKQIWRKHVWVVLSIDLFVCLVLFAIWLWVCSGFQCIES
ncbi:phytolongin Phyl2.2-like [Cucurbita pepo subsp. pepo]|uniref:phytolongin Phyl2.2-like n=1 Tax=Cucurbita pepo subsp. pepo TaxID=3664 RepID=UPI000C9D4873|nr:phytolongin Phyl2.2-like [Cucurbita pepo subsp. pepo]